MLLLIKQSEIDKARTRRLYEAYKAKSDLSLAEAMALDFCGGEGVPDLVIVKDYPFTPDQIHHPDF